MLTLGTVIMETSVVSINQIGPNEVHRSKIFKEKLENLHLSDSITTGTFNL